MAVTEDQVALVQSSWAKVAPLGTAVAGLFYEQLFSIDPGLRDLFSDDMAGQHQKLVAMLDAAVNGLNQLEMLVPAVQDLGVRHVRYGVEEAHYDSVGSALLSTLDKGLGADFTPETREAWTAVYVLLATTMKDAAKTAS